MVGHRSQHRSDRLLLVSPPRAQSSSLFPPLCSSSQGLRARVHGTGATTKREEHAWDRRLVVVVQTNLRVHITSVMNWQGLNSEEEAEKSLKNTAKIHAIITGVSHVELEKKRPVVQVRTARSKTASRSIDWALFSIQTEWRRNASGFESAAT